MIILLILCASNKHSPRRKKVVPAVKVIRFFIVEKRNALWLIINFKIYFMEEWNLFIVIGISEYRIYLLIYLLIDSSQCFRIYQIGISACFTHLWFNYKRDEERCFVEGEASREVRYIEMERSGNGEKVGWGSRKVLSEIVSGVLLMEQEYCHQ